MNVTPMTPLTELRILHDVPLEISYKDTLEFSSVSTQETFKGKTKYTFTDLSPIRMQNMIRVPVVADNLYNCNYIWSITGNTSSATTMSENGLLTVAPDESTNITVTATSTYDTTKSGTASVTVS